MSATTTQDATIRLRVADKEYTFDATTISLKEGIAIEKATGMNIADLANALKTRAFAAFQAIIWIARRRAGETDLALDDVDCALGDIAILNADGTIADDAGKALNRRERRSHKRGKDR